MGGAVGLLIMDANKKLTINNPESSDQINDLKTQLSEEQQIKNKLLKSINRLKKTVFKLKSLQKSKSTKEIDVTTNVIEESFTLTS
jgi:hypothetical protein